MKCWKAVCSIMMVVAAPDTWLIAHSNSQPFYLSQHLLSSTSIQQNIILVLSQTSGHTLLFSLFLCPPPHRWCSQSAVTRLRNETFHKDYLIFIFLDPSSIWIFQAPTAALFVTVHKYVWPLSLFHSSKHHCVTIRTNNAPRCKNQCIMVWFGMQ